MRPGAALIAALGLAAGSAALAQQRSDRVRIDDFAAAPAAEPGVVLGQIAPNDALVTTEQARDRSVATAQPRPPSGAQDVAQVAPRNNSAPLRQVGTAGDRSPVAGPALSRREEGWPTGAERLAGADRCDPQAQDAQERAQCLRILELRAAEFSATEAPRLSAEQELLARQAMKSGTSLATDFMVDRADKSLFDADERNSQELGFLAFNQPPAPSEMPTEEEAGNAALGEAIKGVLVLMGLPNP